MSEEIDDEELEQLREIPPTTMLGSASMLVRHVSDGVRQMGKSFYYETHGCSVKWTILYCLIVLGYLSANIYLYSHLLQPFCLDLPVPKSNMLALSFAYVPDTFFAVGSGFASIDVETPWVLLNILNSLMGGLMILGIIAGGFENFSDYFESQFGVKTLHALTVIYLCWTIGVVPSYCCFVNGTAFYQAIYYSFAVGFTSGMTLIDEVDKPDQTCSQRNLYMHGVIVYLSVIISTSWASSLGGKLFRIASKRLFPIHGEDSEPLLAGLTIRGPLRPQDSP